MNTIFLYKGEQTILLSYKISDNSFKIKYLGLDTIIYQKFILFIYFNIKQLSHTLTLKT